MQKQIHKSHRMVISSFLARASQKSSFVYSQRCLMSACARSTPTLALAKGETIHEPGTSSLAPTGSVVTVGMDQVLPLTDFEPVLSPSFAADSRFREDSCHAWTKFIDLEPVCRDEGILVYTIPDCQNTPLAL